MTTTEKTYTDKQAAFFEALLSEARGDIHAAMTIVGYAKTTKTAKVVSSLKEQITERASIMMAMNAPKAAFGIVDVLMIRHHQAPDMLSPPPVRCWTDPVW